MPSFSFRIKSYSDKPVSIYVSFRPPNSPSVFSRTGLFIHPNEWSESKKKAKPNSTQAKNLNSILSELEIFLVDRLNSDTHEGKVINNAWLKKAIEKFNNQVPETDLSYLSNLLNHLIESLKYKKAKDGSIGLKKDTIKGYFNFQNNITEYESCIGEKINVRDITLNEVNGFVNWLLNEKKYSNNEVSRKVKRLKQLLKYASEKDIKLSVKLSSINDQFNYKTKKYINVISEAEFFKILNLKDLPTYLENVRRWLLIGLNIGQRISDLQRIKQKKIRYDSDGIAFIDIVQKKGEMPVTVPIKIKSVIDILKHRFPYPISDQKFNKYMKEVCERAEINQIVKGYKMNPETKRKELVEAPKYELLSSHDMRRSFATHHYDNGVSVNLIMKITGHKRESTFYEYIGRNPNKDIDAYNFLNAIK